MGRIFELVERFDKFRLKEALPTDDTTTTTTTTTIYFGDIEIVTTKAGTFRVYLAGSGSTVIDWNDGNTTNVTLNGTPTAYNHVYAAGGVITIDDGSTITDISAISQNITECTISADCVAIENITFNGNAISTFETHAEWVNLVGLELNDNNIDSITTYAAWTSMDTIDVGGNNLTSIICHPEWTALRTINIQDNQINSFTTHTEWTSLGELFCEDNNISSLTTYNTWDISDFDASDNNLTTLEAHAEWINIYSFYAQNMALTETAVNNLLTELELAGIGIDMGDEIYLDGGTNAAPTGAGATAKANMIALGATVSTN